MSSSSPISILLYQEELVGSIVSFLPLKEMIRSARISKKIQKIVFPEISETTTSLIFNAWNDVKVIDLSFLSPYFNPDFDPKRLSASSSSSKKRSAKSLNKKKKNAARASASGNNRARLSEYLAIDHQIKAFVLNILKRCEWAESLIFFGLLLNRDFLSDLAILCPKLLANLRALEFRFCSFILMQDQILIRFFSSRDEPRFQGLTFLRLLNCRMFALSLSERRLDSFVEALDKTIMVSMGQDPDDEDEDFIPIKKKRRIKAGTQKTKTSSALKMGSAKKDGAEKAKGSATRDAISNRFLPSLKTVDFRSGSFRHMDFANLWHESKTGIKMLEGSQMHLESARLLFEIGIDPNSVL